MFANETNATVRKKTTTEYRKITPPVTLLFNYLHLRSLPVLVFPCELPLKLITTSLTFLRHPLVLLLLQQRYYLNPFAFRPPIRYGYTTERIFTTTENSRLMQQFPWPSHRRQYDDIYDRPGSYKNPEFSGNDQYPLNPSLQQPQADANRLNMHSTDRRVQKS